MDRDVCLIVNPSAGAGRAAKLLPARRGGAARARHALPRRAHDLDGPRPRAGARRARRRRDRRRDGRRRADRRRGGRAARRRRRARRPPRRPRQRLRAQARDPGTIRSRRASCSRTGAERRIDLAEVGERSYLGIASAPGWTPTPRTIANSTRLKVGTMVYAYGALRALAAWKPARWTVVIDDERAPLRRVLRGRGQLGRVRERDVPRAGRRARRRAARRRALRGHPEAALPAPTCRRCSRARTSASRACTSCAAAR